MPGRAPARELSCETIVEFRAAMGMGLLGVADAEGEELGLGVIGDGEEGFLVVEVGGVDVVVVTGLAAGAGLDCD